MSAPTVAVEWLLARAAVRATGLLHVVSRRDTGALNPVCGANPIRSREIEARTHLDDVSLLCEDCGAMAASIGGTVLDGVALLLGLSSDTTTARLLDVPLTAIRAGETREPGDDLIASVRNNGVLTPIVVRRTGVALELISGGRRYAAAVAAGATSIPAIIRDLDDDETIIDRLLDNLHRENLDPIAQAHAYADALERLNLSKQALADGLGISRPTVSNTIRLLNLPVHLQEHVAAGTFTIEQARALLACTTEDEQDALADAMLAGHTLKQRARATADPQLAAIADLLTQALEAKVDIRTKGATTEIVLRVPTAERDRVLAQLAPAA